MTNWKNILESTYIKNKQLIESSEFIDKLIQNCGITNNLSKGGLILPSGELINMFPQNTWLHYDSLPEIYPEADHGSMWNPKYEDVFDEEVVDNKIIRYCINHKFQPDYIKLPNTNITKQQKEKLQDIFMQLNKDIPVMVEDDITKIVKANQTSVVEDILRQLSGNIEGEFTEDVLDEGDKKIFDKNSGYNSSYDEEFIEEKLKEKYPNLIMSYTDDRFINPETNRHFQLDFYDPDSDTGFNYNKHIKHGRRKFNKNDPNCIMDVKWLESMAEPDNFYEKILHTWRDLDPLKRSVAKEAGLNYIEWFNIDEFLKWYKNPELTYEEYKMAPKSMQYDSDEYFIQKARHRDIYGNDSRWDAD